MITLRALYEIVSPIQFALNDEKLAQVEIHRVLSERLGAERVSREHRLGPGDVPDFLIDGAVVLEVKLKGAKMGIYRQIERYAAYDQVQSLMLASRRAMTLPSLIKGKPALFLSLGRAWL